MKLKTLLLSGVCLLMAVAAVAQNKAIPEDLFFKGSLQEAKAKAKAENKRLMLMVSATFCGPCKDEMPILAKLDGEMGDEVQFLGVVTDVTDQDLNPDQAQVDLAAQLAQNDAIVAYGNSVQAAADARNAAYLNAIAAYQAQIAAQEAAYLAALGL